jgi:hypothetical protein
MNCPDCGIPVEKDAKFCPKCFARIEPPSLWQRFLSLFQPGRHILNTKRTISIKTTDRGGVVRKYHSLDEAPPELRGEIEKLQSEALKADSGIASAEGAPPVIFSLKNVSIFKIRDASGKERIYRSLDELPPEIRAAVEQAQRKAD